MKKSILSVIAATAVLLGAAHGPLSRQWNNLRALVYQADEVVEQSLPAEQLAARARVQLDDKKKELTSCSETIRLTERQIDVREKNLQTRRGRIAAKKQELELAQRKLVLNTKAEQLEIGGQSFPRSVVESDARRRLAELKREVKLTETEQNAIAQMRADLASATSRLSTAFSEIQSRDLEIQQLLVKHHDTEARKVLETLLPQLNNSDSALNDTLNRLYSLADSPQAVEPSNTPRYDVELQNQFPVEDEINSFLKEHQQLLATD